MYNCFGVYDLIAKRSAWSTLAEHIHPGRAGRDKNLYTKTRGSHPHLPLEITEYMHIDVITVARKMQASNMWARKGPATNGARCLLGRVAFSKQLKIKAWKKNMP